MDLPYLKMKKSRKISFSIKNRKVVRKLFHDTTQNPTSYTVTNVEVTKCKMEIFEQMMVHKKISHNPENTFASTPKKKNSKLPTVNINVGAIETLCDFPGSEDATIEFSRPDFPGSEDTTIEFCPPELVDIDLDANSDGINEKNLPSWLYNQN